MATGHYWGGGWVNIAQVISVALQLEQAGEFAEMSCRRAATEEREAR